MPTQIPSIIKTTISDPTQPSSKIENIKNQIFKIINDSDITITEYEFLLSCLNDYKNTAILFQPIKNNI